MSVKPCNDFRNAAIGDLVYCLKSGHGRVVEVLPRNAAYPVHVFFEESDFTETYALDGRLETDDVTPMLYWGVPKIKSEASAPARYRNLNGLAVFESPIKDAREITAGMYLTTCARECGYVKLSVLQVEAGEVEHWVQHGLVYPETEQGLLWAGMHGRAMLGEGTPYEA